MLFTGYFQQVRPRRRSEERMSRINVFIISLQLAVYAFAMLTIVKRIDSTTSSTFMAPNFVYPDEYSGYDQKCYAKLNDGATTTAPATTTTGQTTDTATDVSSTTATTALPVTTTPGRLRFDGDALTTISSANGQRYRTHVTVAYAEVLWNRLLGATMSYVIFNSCLVALSIINKVWFEFGRHAFRIRSLVIHQNIFVTAEFVCAIMSIVSMSEALYLKRLPYAWLTQCDDSDRFNIVTSLPSIPMYIAIAVDLAATAAGVVMYCVYGWRRCRLDYEILEMRADGAEVLRKRPLRVLVNNDPSSRDRVYVEAYKRALAASVSLSATAALGPDGKPLRKYLTTDPAVLAAMREEEARQFEERRREREARVMRAREQNAPVLGGYPLQRPPPIDPNSNAFPPQQQSDGTAPLPMRSVDQLALGPQPSQQQRQQYAGTPVGNASNHSLSSMQWKQRHQPQPNLQQSPQSPQPQPQPPIGTTSIFRSYSPATVGATGVGPGGAGSLPARREGPRPRRAGGAGGETFTF